MDGQMPRQVTPADLAKQGGWATAWQHEPRIPHGPGGGRWTAGGASPAQQQAASGEHESAGRESAEQAERAQARADLAAAAQIEAQVRALRAELRQMRNPAGTGQAAGATTGSGNVSSQLAGQAASTAAGQQQSQASFSQWLNQQRAQENTIEQQIRQLEDRAADLRHQAAQLFRESKAANDAELAKARRRKLRRMPVNTDRFRQVALSGEPVWENHPRHTDGRVAKESEAPMTWAEVYGKARAVAEGHNATPAGDWGVRLNYQPPGPQHQATIATVSGAGPIASSIAAHQGVAHTGHYDAAGHASPDLRPQLGMRAPSAMPVQSEPHPAHTGTGATFGTTPPRQGHGTHLDATGQPFGNRQMPAPLGRVPDVRAPGCDYSMRSPSDG